MKRESILSFVGLVVVLLPFVGLPEYMRTILFVVCGALIVGLAFSLRSKRAVCRPDDTNAACKESRARRTIVASH